MEPDERLDFTSLEGRVLLCLLAGGIPVAFGVGASWIFDPEGSGLNGSLELVGFWVGALAFTVAALANVIQWLFLNRPHRADY